ncbi:hypothetical protein KF913_05335 [Candidatus Obscuribacterales bacterium]|nr:hypothetical protein [Candidatus Obscuribacterales bacterium]
MSAPPAYHDNLKERVGAINRTPGAVTQKVWDVSSIQSGLALDSRTLPQINSCQSYWQKLLPPSSQKLITSCNHPSIQHFPQSLIPKHEQ